MMWCKGKQKQKVNNMFMFDMLTGQAGSPGLSRRVSPKGTSRTCTTSIVNDNNLTKSTYH
ncbi:hypothetical protein MKW98_019117, partial [Papaver atlanticum]